MKDCWINMLELYQILDALSEQGIITEGQRSIIEAHVDGMEFICVPKETDADLKCFMCEEKEAAYKVGYEEGLKAGKSAFNEGSKE